MDYSAIFERREFSLDDQIWTARVENTPGADGRGDLIVFDLAFKERAGQVRRLRLLASDAGIHTLNHTPQLYECVRLWLHGQDESGEVKCF